ncbi:hypothetical protein ACFPLB_14160 [Aquamicrobium segne]|uniref:Uncharacterized protein n=1 Tax=Aquamicrobium segne TaxID=469547 RepID=A0ABW0H1F3_9HYPH
MNIIEMPHAEFIDCYLLSAPVSPAGEKATKMPQATDSANIVAGSIPI